MFHSTVLEIRRKGNVRHNFLYKLSDRKALCHGSTSWFAMLTTVIALFVTIPASADTWRGTAPFCAGACLPGETQIATSSSGDGATCWTGHKVLCRNNQPTCTPRQTTVTCYLFVEICDNGFFETPTSNWHSCSKFACGACFGTSAVGTSSQALQSSIGSSQQALQASQELARFAAIWQKPANTANIPWVARHGMTSAQYQEEFTKFSQNGYRLVNVSGYEINGQDYYAGIWDKSPGGAWAARHGMTSAQYQAEFDTFAKQGYRLVDISAYNVAGHDRYAAIWERASEVAWVARHGMTSAQYQAEFDTLAKQGYRLTVISGYDINGQDHYAAIWEKTPGAAWVARHGMTSAQYQAESESLAKQGYRLVRVSAWEVAGAIHYAAIWDKSSHSASVAHVDMTSTQYQTEFEGMIKNGYRLVQVSGYHSKKR